MSGTRSEAGVVLTVVAAYASAAVTVNQYLVEVPVPCDCRIGGIKVRAGTAGSGAGSTVVDVQVNGASIFAAPADRPTLTAASTGEFTNRKSSRQWLQSGRVDATGADVLAVQVTAVPASAGHARVGVSIALERPD